MAFKSSIWNRKLHRRAAVAFSVPILVILSSGILLQLKKNAAWIQPPTQRGAGTVPRIGFDEILKIARSVPEAGIERWEDIERLDVRPAKGIVKVRARNSWELQIDTRTREVLQTAYRRSDLIENIHDGSWFHETAKLWIFLPSGIVLLLLLATGLYLFVLPYLAKRR